MVQDNEETNNDVLGDDITIDRKAVERLLHLPESFYIGQAAGQGDCFFDSVAQGLSQIRPKDKFSVKSLRMVCKTFAESSLSNDRALWFHQSLAFEEKSNRELPLDRYIESVEFTAAECSNMPALQNGPVWGRPEIEGRILCEEYDVKLHVTERHQQGWTNDRVSATGSMAVPPQYGDENTVHIVNYNGYHFEPILHRHYLQTSRLQHLKDECDLENRQVDETLRNLGALFSGNVRSGFSLRQDPIGDNPAEDPGAVVDCTDMATFRDAVVANNVDLVWRLLKQCPSWPFNLSSVPSDSVGGILHGIWSLIGVNEEGVAGEMRGLLEEEVSLRKYILDIAQTMSSARDIARRSREGCSKQPDIMILELLDSTSKALTSWNDLQERSSRHECHHHTLTLLSFSLVANNIQSLQEQSDKLGLPRTLYLEVEDCLSGILTIVVNYERLKGIVDNVRRLKIELLQGFYNGNVAEKVDKCDSLLRDICGNYTCRKPDVDSVKRLLKQVEDLRDRIPAAKLQIEDIDDISTSPSKEDSSSCLSLVKEKLILDELIRNLQVVHQEEALWSHRFLMKRMLQLNDQSVLKPLQSIPEVDGSSDLRDIWKKIQDGIQDASERLVKMALGKSVASQEDVTRDSSDDIECNVNGDVSSSITSEVIDVKFGQLLDCITDNASVGDKKLTNHNCAQTICTRFVTATTRSEIRTAGRQRSVMMVRSSGISGHENVGKTPASIENSVDSFISDVLGAFLQEKASEESILKFQTNTAADCQLNQAKSSLPTFSKNSLAFPSTVKVSGQQEDKLMMDIFSRISKFSSAEELLDVCRHSSALRTTLDMLVWESLKNLKATSSPAVYIQIENVLLVSLPFTGHLPYCPLMSVSLFDFLCPGSLLGAFDGDRLLATVLIGWFLATEGEMLMAIRNLLEVNGGCEFLVNSIGTSLRDDVLKKPSSKFDKLVAIVQASQFWKKATWKRKLISLLKNGQVLEDEGSKDQRYVGKMFQLEIFNECNFKHIASWRTRTDITAIKGSRGYSLLHAACKVGDGCLVKDLLEHGWDVNAIDDDQNTPLHVASYNDNIDILQTLIANSANLNLTNDHQFTALHIAASCGHFRVVEVLLNSGADMEATTGSGFTPLFLALPHTQVVKALLEDKANVNARSKENSTPLHEASRSGHKEVAKLLLEHGAKINAMDNSFGTPLHAAVVVRQLDIVRTLLHHGADVYDICRSKSTLVHHAAFCGHAKILKILLEKGLKVDKADEYGMTPLHSAVLGGHPHVLEILRPHFPTPAFVDAVDAKRRTALHYAAMQNDVRLIDALVGFGASEDAIDEYGSTCKHFRGIPSDLNIAENLNQQLPAGQSTPLSLSSRSLPLAESSIVDDGVQKTCRSQKVISSESQQSSAVTKQEKEEGKLDIHNQWTPIHIAVVNNDVGIVRTLLLNKGGVDTLGPEDATPLHLAAELGYANCVDILLKKGANVNAMSGFHRCTSLHLASMNGHVAIIQKLILAGAYINCRDDGGNTPVHLAAEGGATKVAELLLDNGAAVDCRNGCKRKPLHIAALNGHCTFLEMLLRRQSSVNSVDASGQTSLSLAVLRNQDAAIAALLSHGADSSIRDNDGWAPLHVAVRSDSLDIVRTLLDSQADVDIRGQDALSPLHLAVVKGSVRSAGLLLVRGASVNNRNSAKQSPLHMACHTGDIVLVRMLLSKGADTGVEDIEGFTPLLAAVRSGHADVVQELVSSGSNLESWSQRHGTRPLHAAIAGRNLDVIRVLVDGGASVNAQCGNRLTPLWLAAFYRYPEAIDLLLGRKANVNATDQQNNTALHTAARLGYLDVVEALLINGANVDALNNRNWTPLHDAIDGRHGDVVAMLLDKGASLDIPLEKRLLALHLAADLGDLDIVMLLEASDADINVRDMDQSQTPLHHAVRNGHVEVAQYLVLKGAEVNEADSGCLTSLRLAIGIQNSALVNFLLDNGADVNAKDGSQMTPLQTAVKNGASVELIQALLNYGAEVDAGQEQGLTPLHMAVAQNSVGISNVLLNNGADVNARTIAGATVLHIVAGLGHMPLAELLLESFADVNCTTTEGLTPLHEAAGEGHLEVVIVLLDHGADVNASDAKDHFRPLHCAACEGHSDVVETLVGRGAQVDAVLKNGKTALYLAADSGRVRATKALLKHGANVFARTANGSTMLHAAAIGNDAEIIQLVLNAMTTGGQPDPKEATNDRGDTALILAAWSKKKIAVDTLLKLGVSPDARNCKGFTGLHYAARNGDRDIVILCCEAATGDKVDMLTNFGETALHLAILSNHPEVVETLLDKGASVHLLTGSHFTPLHLAAEHGFGKILEVLCRFGADVNAANNVDLFTPLHLAAMEGHAKAVEILVGKGALLDQTLNGFDITPLYLAVQNGHAKAAKVLMDNGASPVVVKHPNSVLHAAVCSRRIEMVNMVISKINSEEFTAEPFLNAVDYAGDTPLMWAAEAGKTDICKLLLNHGASVHLQNEKKMTALHWAATNGHPDVVKLLLRYRAKRDIEDDDGNTPLYLAMCGLALQDGRGEAFDGVVKLLSRK